MFQRAALASLFLAVATAGPASAQINLRWKFQEGDTFWIEEKITAKTEVTANGEKFTDEQTQYRLSKFEVKNSTADLMIIQQQIEVWQSKITGRPTGNEEDTEKLEKLCKNVVLTMYMSPVGKITRYDGYDKFLKNFATEYPADFEQFKAIAGSGDDLLRGPLTEVFDILVADKVKKGQTWKRDNTVKLGPLGRFNLATTFTYVGKESRGERVDTKAILSFQPPEVGPGEVGFKIVKVDLTKKEAKGHFFFNNAKGQLVELTRTTPLAGKLTLDVQGKQSEILLDGTETRTIRLLEKDPRKTKK